MKLVTYGANRRGSLCELEGPLDGTDILLAAVRWIHVVAAVVWVGGSIFYLLVLQPALSLPDTAKSRPVVEYAINHRFRDLIDVSIVALIVTGVAITFDRLSSLPITTAYYSVLGLKIFAFLTMLIMARELGSRIGRSWRAPKMGPKKSSTADTRQGHTPIRWLLSPSRVILVMGLFAFFLSALLVHVYESGVAGI